MKLELLPEFAKPYKKTGYDVRLKGNSYQLFRISSQRVEGKKYPVLKQEYIGVIQPDGSLKKKANRKTESLFQEFGLSDFIFRMHHRTLMRSFFNSAPEFARPIVLLAILHYTLGSISDTAINRCRLTAGHASELTLARELKMTVIERLSRKIAQEQEQLLGEDKIEFELLMRLCVVDVMSVVPPSYPQPALEILNRRGISL